MADKIDKQSHSSNSAAGNNKPFCASGSAPQRDGLTTEASNCKTVPESQTTTPHLDGGQPAWRQDFPVDWPQQNYVVRREFVKFLILTSGALVSGQLWIGIQQWRRSKDQLQPKKIASLSTLPVGGVMVFTYPLEHDNCVLIRAEKDLLLAYSQKCTHLSCAVIPKPREGVIHCPCHEGYFDLKTGNVLAGPPPRPLPKITLEIRGDEVFATGIELRTV